MYSDRELRAKASKLSDEDLVKLDTLLSRLEDTARALRIQESSQDPSEHTWHRHIEKPKSKIVSAEAYEQMKSILEGK
jgi:hypothetical protein